MNEEKIKYGEYCRKSTEAEDKQILSIESQRSENAKTIKSENLSVLENFEESHSAKTPYTRPEFEKMFKKIEKGEINGIFSWSPNRLSRNSIDTGRLIYLMDEGKLLEVRTPGQIFKNTPSDKFLLNLFCSQAKLENDNKGVDVKRGLDKKAEMGWLPSGAKPGYMNDPFAEKGNKRIMEDLVRFPLIKEAWELLLTGNYSVARILKILNEDLGYRSPKKRKIGGKPMVRSQIYTMFRDPFYYGWFERRKGSGEWFEGKHKRMITEEEYWRAQEILGIKGRPQPKKIEFAFTGMIRCGQCGAMITAENKTKHQKNGNVHRYKYYHCTGRKDPNCKQKALEEEKLEEQIIKKLDEIKIPDEFHAFALKWMENENKKHADNTQKILAKTEKEYAECINTIDGIIDMRARQEIDQEDYNRRLFNTKKEKARLEALKRNTEQQIDVWIQIANDGFEFVEHAKDKFKNGSVQTRKAILSTLGSNLVLIDKILNIDTEKTLLPIKDVSLEANLILENVRTSKKLIDKKEIERFYAESPILLHLIDIIRTWR